MLWVTDRRYYLADVFIDLFGTPVLVRRWGGHGRAPSRCVSQPCASIAEAIRAQGDVGRRRATRGYRLSDAGSCGS